MLSTRAALWRDRTLRFAMGGGAIVVGAVLGALRNKWLAEHLATAGVGVLAQVTSAQTWLGTAAGLGLSLPVARAVGAAGDDDDAVRRTLSSAFRLVLVATLAVVIPGFLLAPRVSSVLLGSEAHAGLIRISMLGVAGFALHAVTGGFFSGRSDVRAPLVQALVGGAAAVALTVALVPRAGLAGGAIGAAVLVPVGLAAAWSVRRRSGTAPAPERREASPAGGLHAATAVALLRVGLAALALALLDQGALLALRAHYLRAHGMAANGLLQAALVLAQQVSNVFFAYLAGYAFGRIAKAADAAGVRDYTRRHWVPLVGLSAAAFALAMILALPLIALFFSDRFAPARPLMAWALFGEFCRVMTQVWALGALPVGGIRAWMPIGIAGPAALVAAYAWLAPRCGLLALPYASALASLAQLAVAGVIMSRHGVTPRPGDAALLALALAGLAGLAWTVAG